MEDPVEVGLPGGDHLLVVLRVCESRQQIPPTFLDNLLLDSRYGSAIEDAVSERIQYFVYHNR